MTRKTKQESGRKQNEHSELKVYKIPLLDETRRAIQTILRKFKNIFK
jgi:hypothetical protein